MAEPKTRPTGASVAAYLAAIADDKRRRDCDALVAIMHRATGEEPKMWGPSIVGFGRYRYKYDSGREGESCIVGFSSRADGVSVYLTASGPDQAKLLARLGRHKMGKACLKIGRLSDVDPDALERLVGDCVAESRRRHP